MTKYACITLDMEPDYGDPLKHVHLLDDRAHLDRFADIINRYDAKVTMFTVTSLFDPYGEKLRQLEERVPLEYAVHSHTHDPRNGSSGDELAAAHEAFTHFTGKKPEGYRAPIGRIDKEGLGRLIDLGYQLDSSIYNSIRPGEYGYFNLHVPNVPFWLTRGGHDCLLEFPFTAISAVRIVFALSYVKLLGWPLYSLLLKLFGLPDMALLLIHPYNLYTRRNAAGLHGLEKLALTRNDGKSYEYFENMVAALRHSGYRFIFVSEMYELLQNEENVPRLAWEDWK
jgi:peptidoglycan/xylan/chitin deacetylase (PgdA/CDA1 family)